MSVLSLIAARENSKGIKNKVVQKINNKYLFEYAIDYSLGLEERIEEDVFTAVSSDSLIIEEYCLRKDIPFIRRKPELASDTARMENVAFDAYKIINKSFKYISLIYGNIPMRYPDEFLKAFMFLEKNADYDAVLSMQNVEKHNPAWMFELNKDSLLMKKEEGFRRQGLKQFMIHDGHTILIRTDYFINFMEEGKTAQILYEAFGKKIKPMLNDKLIIDIDTQRDLVLAEAVLRCSK